MNYQRIYTEFIATRRARGHVLGSYVEKHHVLPVSLGGSNRAENLIVLTAREHYFAHCCLAKIHGGKMWSALHVMAAMTKTDGAARYFLRGRMVAVAKREAALRRRENMKELWRSGKFTRNREYGPLSAETKAKISAGNQGKKLSTQSVMRRTEARKAKLPRFSFVLGDCVFFGTAQEFCDHTGISQPLASCLTRQKIKSAKNWTLAGTDPKRIRNRDHTLRIFAHKDGSEFEGTSYDFRTRFGLDSGVICNLIKGTNGVKSFKGWRYKGETDAR